tara:strand:+ start:2196 stop:2408 length:213 start_codon:yes stop_codon:yes gene_type:complete
MNKVIVLGVGVLAAGVVAGAMVGGKKAYNKYSTIKEKAGNLRDKFYDDVVKIDNTSSWDDSDIENQVAWG